jgi:hypothetical protein
MHSQDSLNTSTSQRRDSCPEAALRYAKGGWHVFPAPPGQKKSYKKGANSNGARWGATSDTTQVRKDFMTWPMAGIGIPTGPENGFWVLEADTPEGHDVDGIAALKALEDEHGKLPLTRMAVSPSGSLHYYFTWPDDGTVIGNSTGKIAKGIDTRGAGGMVLGPPSYRPGKGVYRWLNDAPIVAAPEWLLALVPKKSDSDGEAYEGDPEADPERVARAVKILPNECDEWDEWNRYGDFRRYRRKRGRTQDF